jgi:hypothetical protein
MPSCREYKPGNILAGDPLNWDEIINKDNDHDEKWADPRVPTHEWCRPGAGKDNDNGKNEQNMQGSEKRSRKGNGTKAAQVKETATENRKGQWNGKGNRNSNVKGIVEQSARGDDISSAIALQLQKEMAEAD